MAAIAPEQRHTAEELLTMPGGQSYQLVNGELVEKKMGTESSRIAGESFRRLANFNLEARLGWVLPAEASYQCFPDDPGRVRRPDASFIRFGRLAGERIPEGHTPVAPDMVVEVVSPNDTYSEVRVKVGEYLRAGVRAVWIVDPRTRSVERVRAGEPVSWLQEQDDLADEALLPGFRVRVAELFPSLSAPAS